MVAGALAARQISGVHTAGDTSILLWQPGWVKGLPYRIAYLLRLKKCWNGAFSINCTRIANPT
jgi:hypothetical protein